MRWKPVTGFEGRYEVSDTGIVRSVRRPGFAGKQGGEVLKARTTGSGYLAVNLWIKGKQKTRLIHQLVLLAFCGKRPNGHETRHLNGEKTDNRLSNLRWGTHSENMIDRTGHGRFIKISEPQLRSMFVMRRAGKTLREIAEIVGCSTSYASKVLRGERRNKRR